MLTMIPCPKCKVRLQTPDNLLGKAIHCPKCKKAIRLALRGNSAASKAPPSSSTPFPDTNPSNSSNAPTMSPLEEDDFVAGLEQVHDIDNIEMPPDEPAVPPKATEKAPADGLEEFMEEAVEEEAAVEAPAEVSVEDEVSEDEVVIEDKKVEEEVVVEDEVVEEEVAVEDEVVEEEVVEEQAVVDTVEEDVLEEEPAAEGEEDQLPKAVQKFMIPKVFLIKGQSGIFSMNAAWDFLNPDTKKKIGSAVERPEGMLQVLRFFMRRNWLPSKIEVREEKTNELVFIVKRPPYFFNCTLEVHDPNNKLLAKFTYKPLSRMVGKPMPIERKGGVKFATCEFYFLKGRVDLMDDKKTELANMQTESAYTKAIKIYWAPRGGSYYVTFNKPLIEKPFDKMIFLGVTLAMDLMQEDAKASTKGGGGFSIGT